MVSFFNKWINKIFGTDLLYHQGLNPMCLSTVFILSLLRKIMFRRVQSQVKGSLTATVDHFDILDRDHHFYIMTLNVLLAWSV